MKTLTADALRDLTRALDAIAEDHALLTPFSNDERKALLRAAGKLANPERDAHSRFAKAQRKRRREELRQRDRAARSETGIRALRARPIFEAPLRPQLTAGAQPSEPVRELEQPRKCYVCKAEYRHLHFFYDAMCGDCGDFNHARRSPQASLTGKVALITGARVKIGYQASLMLLRAGARVIATTRFPNDATARYVREPDFEQWGHRLQIHGLDLRHAPSVEVFARHVAQTHDRLDILINNAAQTVRRPPGFYAHLLPFEQMAAEALPERCAPLLAGHQELLAAVQGSRSEATPALTPGWRTSDATVGLHSSAALAQLPYGFESEGDVNALFPRGRLDADLQQVDLREMNSWRLKLADVETPEMLEVHLVNAVAPFILCAKLKPLMLRDRRAPGHIVNVSAMEGSFSRGTKTDRHPHTNMAKAALNMLTLTSAPDYARDHIYMNAVDTGWVTDEDPVVLAQRKVEDLDFQPPLDIVDGAARVVDPVFSAENGGPLQYGKFFKDYRPTAW